MKKKEKNNYYSGFSSNFINPLKYLKKSFQKKQEEKFGYDSDENSSNSKSYEEEIKTNNNKKINLRKEFFGKNCDNNTKKIINDDMKNEEKKNERTNSLEKEGDTKESTQSQHEDRNISIRQKYKNRRSK